MSGYPPHEQPPPPAGCCYAFPPGQVYPVASSLQPQQYGAPPPSNPSAPPQGYAQAPPQGYAQAPQQGYAQAPPPPPPQNILFRFSGKKEDIKNSVVTDPWNRIVLTVTSAKRQTKLINGENRLVAMLDWDHESPRIDYRGQVIKTKEFLPYKKENKVKFRTLTYNGRLYDWVEESNKDRTLFLRGSIRSQLAVVRKDHTSKQISVEISSEALQEGMLEPCLISAFLFHSGEIFNDVDDDDRSYMYGVWASGAIAH